MSEQKRSGFWQRQFVARATRAQVYFDVVFGIVAPVTCLVFDPGVFNGSLLGGQFVGIRVFSYAAMTLGIATLAIWLTGRVNINQWTGFLAGVLFVGTLFSLAVGIALLPLSLIGLLFLIGALGFVPFLTAFVFLRNAVRALRQTRPAVKTRQLAPLVLLGAVLVIAVPVFIQWQTTEFVTRSVRDVVQGQFPAADNAMQRLKYAFWCTDTCFDEIISLYRTENSPMRKAYLSRAYKELTGEDIEAKLRPNFD